MIIAIDGPSASGKGAIGRQLAEQFNLRYLDTGLLYRLVGRACWLQEIDPMSAQAAKVAASLDYATIDETGLRTEAVGRYASQVGANQKVREALYHFQRDFAEHQGDGYNGAVLDGRDIGSVIYPETPYKIFVTADLEARVKRRYEQLKQADLGQKYEEVLRDLTERDTRDRAREASPLVPAADAFVLDTTQMDLNEAISKTKEFIVHTQQRLQ